jgi:uncharacterized protein with HEPN domain
MQRDPEVYVQDMLDAIRAVRDYTAGMDRASFESDRRTVDAVVRNLEVLGEAAKSVPDDVRARHASIEWRKIAGLRDVIIHRYFAVDLTIVWQVVTEKLRPLERELRDIQAELRGPE